MFVYHKATIIKRTEKWSRGSLGGWSWRKTYWRDLLQLNSEWKMEWSRPEETLSGFMRWPIHPCNYRSPHKHTQHRHGTHTGWWRQTLLQAEHQSRHLSALPCSGASEEDWEFALNKEFAVLLCKAVRTRVYVWGGGVEGGLVTDSLCFCERLWHHQHNERPEICGGWKSNLLSHSWGGFTTTINYPSATYAHARMQAGTCVYSTRVQYVRPCAAQIRVLMYI